ncbi:MAG TPA: flagellin [Rhizomicrobium sp.]|jgi:flagellar hook-associated protein 3 FlgL
MSIDRVATNSQSQFLIQEMMQAQSSLNTTDQQVSTGMIANTYGGYGDKAALLEAARSAQNRANSYQSATTLALTQSDLQNTQLTQLSSIAQQLQQDISEAVANNDGSSLMTQAGGLYQQAEQILNSQDANGNYIYGGDKNNAPPLTTNSLSDLGTLGSVSQAFANGSKATSVRVADGETVQVGVLASNVGTGIMQVLKDLVDYTNANGGLTTNMTSAQSNFLSGEIGSASTAAQGVNAATAANGNVYDQLQSASDQQQSMSTLYQGFVSNLQDVDMSTAITQLNQNQVALQASEEVTSQLNKTSLLNYLTG